MGNPSGGGLEGFEGRIGERGVAGRKAPRGRASPSSPMEIGGEVNNLAVNYNVLANVLIKRGVKGKRATTFRCRPWFCNFDFRGARSAPGVASINCLNLRIAVCSTIVNTTYTKPSP